MSDESTPTPTAHPATTHADLTHVWNDHPNTGERRDMSHWRGEGRWDDETWSAIGLSTLRSVRTAAWALGRPTPSGPLLEWGPGGGSNLVAFAGSVSKLYGADVSPNNLEEAGRVISGLDNPPPFVPIVVGDDPTAVLDSIEDPIELFVSTAVFQHFPNREYGAEVLRTVARALAPDALGLIQIRYDNGAERYAQKDADYRRQYVTFTSYPLDGFWDLLESVGLRPLGIADVHSAYNYATFTFASH